MYSIIEPQSNHQITKPAQYLIPAFKIYILQHLLHQLFKKTILFPFNAMKDVEKQRKITKNTKKRLRNNKIRTEWDESAVSLTESRYSFSNESYHQLTPKYQSPYRLTETDRSYKTQYFDQNHNLTYHGSYRHDEFNSKQFFFSKGTETFRLNQGQFISPYRKKDNVSIVDVNESAQRINKDKFESRVWIEQDKNKGNRVKKCAIRLMHTTLKYTIHRLNQFFFKNVRSVNVLKQREDSIKMQHSLKSKVSQYEQTISKMSKQLSDREKQVKQYKKQLKVYRLNHKNAQKLAKVFKIRLKIYLLLLRKAFDAIFLINEHRCIVVSPQNEGFIEYTIVYNKDEDFNPVKNNSNHNKNSLKLTFSQPKQAQKIPYSYRSGATQSSFLND